MNKNRLPQAVALGLVTEATLRHATTTRLHKLILAGVFDSSADNYRSLDMPPGTSVVFQGTLSACRPFAVLCVVCHATMLYTAGGPTASFSC
jgi:hypothetical protein